jgi:hypothetical protein
MTRKKVVAMEARRKEATIPFFTHTAPRSVTQWKKEDTLYRLLFCGFVLWCEQNLFA